jgi:hypothetical protein
MATLRDLSCCRVDREFVHELADSMETMSNLAYLICADAKNPELVERYANQVEQCVRRVADLLRELPPDLRM